MGVGLPDAQRRELGPVLLELIQHLLDHPVGQLRPPRRLAVEDGQRLDLVPVLGKIALKILRQRLGIFGGIAFPLGAQNRVDIVVIDRLFLVAADGVDQLDQRAGKDGRCLPDQLVARLSALLIGRLGAACRFARAFLDAVGIDRARSGG